MKITTARQARQLIGREIRYRKTYESLTHTAIIKDVEGKNIELFIIDAGWTDWLWIPDMIMETIEPTESTQPTEQSP